MHGHMTIGSLRLLKMAETEKMTCKKSHNFSAAEQSALVDEVESRKEVLFAKFNNVITNENKRKAWEEIATKVNAVNPGSDRTAIQIKKKWQDFQSRTKRKEAERRRDLRQTGGGPLCSTKLSDMEGKVISLLGDTAIDGIPGGEDSLSASSASVILHVPSDGKTSVQDLPEGSTIADLSFETVPAIPQKKTKIDEELIAIERERRDIERERLRVDQERLEVEKERRDIERERLQLEQSRSMLPVPVLVAASNSQS